MSLEYWAIRHHVSYEALVELRAMWNEVGAGYMPPEAKGATSEAAVSSVVMLEAARKDVYLLRNNVGVLEDRNGRPVRFGLANDRKESNQILKSGDFIGVRPVLVTQQHVGVTLGQFVSREIKATGWRYTGTEREVAQLAWANKIISLGGDAAFATGEGTL